MMNSNIVFEATPDWLSIVEKAGEICLSSSLVSEEERHHAFCLVDINDPYERESLCDVSRVFWVHDRHTAIRAGDLCITRRSAGIYSETTHVWFVRLVAPLWKFVGESLTGGSHWANVYCEQTQQNGYLSVKWEATRPVLYGDILDSTDVVRANVLAYVGQYRLTN